MGFKVDKIMKLKPKVILFDMDGVLVDSLDAWWASLNQALIHFNYKEISKAEFIEKYWGFDLKYNIEKMGLNYKVLNFCNTICGNYVDNVILYNDTRETLEKLYPYKKVLITNTPKNCTMQILKNYDLEKYFEIVLTSDDVNKGKPSPEIVLKACESLNVKPVDAIFIGDTKNDVIAGKEAGCIVIGIKIKADFTINSLSDLIDLLI